MTVALDRLTTEELRELRRALEHGDLAAPFDARALGAAGFDRLRDRVAVLHGLDAGRVTALLDAFLAERERQPPPPELVWTGPEDDEAEARDTAVRVRQLFDEAQHEVLLAGYAFTRGERILAPLHRAMSERGVKCSIFLDLPKRARVPSDVDRLAGAQLRAFLAKQWPFGPPFPELYYDPRTVSPEHQASLHAKCVVVDERIAFVGSANFTDRAQTRNIEAGVVLHDARFARQLAEQLRGLVRGRWLLRYEGA